MQGPCPLLHPAPPCLPVLCWSAAGGLGVVGPCLSPQLSCPVSLGWLPFLPSRVPRLAPLPATAHPPDWLGRPCALSSSASPTSSLPAQAPAEESRNGPVPWAADAGRPARALACALVVPGSHSAPLLHDPPRLSSRQEAARLPPMRVRAPQTLLPLLCGVRVSASFLATQIPMICDPAQVPHVRELCRLGLSCPCGVQMGPTGQSEAPGPPSPADRPRAGAGSP